MAIRKTLLALARRAWTGPNPSVGAAPRGRPPVVPLDPPLPPAADPEPPLEVDKPLPGSLLLDIREPGELAGGVASTAMLLPMNCVPLQLDTLDRAVPITVYCAAGARSLGVAHWLREQGFQAVSLEGGIQTLRWGGVEMRVPDRAGERVPLTADLTVDGVAVVAGHIERVDGDRVRVTDATGLEVVGRVGSR